MPSLKTLTIRTPAKINLLLYVLGPGPGGYHRILSLMQMVDLCDRLTFTRRPVVYGVRLITRSRNIPLGKDNLVIRAARAFFKCYGIEAGLRVELDKKIPIGAGLGGGSSDAAATLQGLCRLFRLDPPRSELMALGRSLGSDVSFFLRGPTAWVSGIGDRVDPTRLDGRPWAVLVNPGFEVSTAWAYTELDRIQPRISAEGRTFLKKMGLTLRGNPLRISLRAKSAFSLTRRSSSLHNDLEAVTIRRYPVIAAIKERLRSFGAKEVLMSGSGPTVFGLFPDRNSAHRAAKKLRAGGRERGAEDRPRRWTIWVVRLRSRPTG